MKFMSMVQQCMLLPAVALGLSRDAKHVSDNVVNTVASLLAVTPPDLVLTQALLI